MFAVKNKRRRRVLERLIPRENDPVYRWSGTWGELHRSDLTLRRQ